MTPPIKTFNQIYWDANQTELEDQKLKIVMKLVKGWRYCCAWFIISFIAIAFWPWETSWILLIFFPIVAILMFINAVFKVHKLNKKELDLSALPDKIPTLDRIE